MFRDLLQMTRSNLKLIYRIKLQIIILSNYDEICAKIKTNLQFSRKIFLL